MSGNNLTALVTGHSVEIEGASGEARTIAASPEWLRERGIVDDDGAALARDSARGGALPLVLRVELEEFSQLFSSPGNSVAAVRMRATLVDLTPAGEVLRGQKVFVAQVPARSADAVGGVQALSEAATQCANELSAWIDAASAP